MPLTLSHPAVLLPLRRLGLPFTALAVGSMVPDIPLFMRWDSGYVLSHHLSGVATVDLVLTVVIVRLWFSVVRDALVDLAPDPIRSRLAPHVSLTRWQWLLVVPSAWFGAFTHVFWDAFTHPGRGGVSRIRWLQDEHGPLSGYRWAQYISGVIGFAIVAFAIVRYLRSLPAVPRVTARPAWADRASAAAAVATVVTALVTALIEARDGLHAVAFNSVVNAIIVGVGSVLVMAMAWRLGSRK